MSIIFSKHEQGSEGWHKERLGVITASQAHALLPNARTKTFQYKEARATYMNQLIAEVCTGHFDNLDTYALQWGRDNEASAIAAFEFATSKTVEKVGLAYKDESRRVAASADFLISGERCGGENKCPINPLYHIDFLLDGEIKQEYITQIQFSMWNYDWDLWFMNSYHPKMRKKNQHHKVIERNLELSKYFDEEVPRFCAEMDKKLKELGFEWGSQWL